MFYMLNISVNEAHIITCIVNHAETGTEMLNILKNTRGKWGEFSTFRKLNRYTNYYLLFKGGSVRTCLNKPEV